MSARIHLPIAVLALMIAWAIAASQAYAQWQGLCPGGQWAPDSSGLGYVCIPGSAYQQPRYPKGAVICGSGRYCQESQTCCGNKCCAANSFCSKFGCVPAGAIDCGTHACPSGRKCGSSGTCLALDAVDCGTGKSCPAGKACWTVPEDYESLRAGQELCATPEQLGTWQQAIQLRAALRQLAKEREEERARDRTKRQSDERKKTKDAEAHKREELQATVRERIAKAKSVRDTKLLNLSKLEKANHYQMAQIKSDLLAAEKRTSSKQDVLHIRQLEAKRSSLEIALRAKNESASLGERLLANEKQKQSLTELSKNVSLYRAGIDQPTVVIHSKPIGMTAQGQPLSSSITDQKSAAPKPPKDMVPGKTYQVDPQTTVTLLPPSGATGANKQDAPLNAGNTPCGLGTATTYSSSQGSGTSYSAICGNTGIGGFVGSNTAPKTSNLSSPRLPKSNGAPGTASPNDIKARELENQLRDIAEMDRLPELKAKPQQQLPTLATQPSLVIATPPPASGRLGASNPPNIGIPATRDIEGTPIGIAPSTFPLNPAAAIPLIDKTTAKQLLSYAILSRDAYDGKGASAVGYRRATEWDALLERFGASDQEIERLRKSGFSATIFTKGTSTQGDHEVVIAFRGTETPSVTDWTTNIGANVLAESHFIPRQYEAASNLIRQAQRQFPGATIVVTGHSLGGALASYAGNQVGVRIRTFNAARNSYSTQYGMRAISQINIASQGDLVGDPLKNTIAGKGTLPGSTIVVNSSSGQGLLNAHGIDGIIGALSDMSHR